MKAVGRTLLLAWVALAAPLVAASPEFLVGSTVPTAAPDHRETARVATDGTDFLAVWVDYRTPGAGPSIIGTRITREGRVVDPLGIRIATPPGGVGAVHVVWDGEAYLLMWSAQFSIQAARVDRDGRTIMQPRVLRTNAAVPYDAVVASNGTVTAIAYYTYVSWAATKDIRVLTIDREGNELRETAMPVTSSATNYALAATPSRFLFAWSSSTGMWGEAVLDALALNPDGSIAAGPVRLGEGSGPEVATDGTNFVVVAAGVERAHAHWTFRAHALTPDLAPIGDVETLTTGWEPNLTSVLWRRGRYEVLLARRPEKSTALESFVFELEPDGDVIASHPRNHMTAHAVTNGQDVVALFNVAGPAAASRVFARVYRNSLQTADAVELLSWSGNSHTDPVIVAGSANHLVAWVEEDGVYATRIDAQGSSVDGRGIQLAPRGHGVRAAFDGTNYVAAWVEGHEVVVRTIAAATGAAGADVRLPSASWASIALAASPEATYVVIADFRLRVTRIPHATRVPDPLSVTVSPEDTPVMAPTASWNGTMLLVVWNDESDSRGSPPIAYPFRTLAARVTGDLTLLDPTPLVITRAKADWDTVGAPSVATNGDDWLVVLEYVQTDVLARRVGSDGTLSGNDAERIAGGTSPVATWDGTRYSVAWKDRASVRLGAIPAAGPLLLSRQMLVTTHTAPGPLSIAPAGNEEVAITYTKVSFRPEHNGVERTFLRFMDYNASRGRVVRR